MASAEFVRDAALSVADGKSVDDLGKITPGIVTLIESTFRSAYFVATPKRDELTRERREDEVDEMVQAGRDVQALLLNRVSE